jgi:AAA domain
MSAEQYAPPFPEKVIGALSQHYAGVTLESAARLNGCLISELTEALAHPDAKFIEPASEWDSVDLLSAEFYETPDILAGLIPVGVTLVSAAPKVGKTRWMTQLSAAAVRGAPFLGREVTRTKVLTLALEDGARRYRQSLRGLVGNTLPGRSELTIRTTSARLNEGGITQIE